jgi:DNA polymerase-3 subunit gamma/tau
LAPSRIVVGAVYGVGMSYQVLARKLRPRTFEDVVGQEHVTRSLQNALKNKKLAHAYLFTGTRGVGKTTLTRLFAKAILCEQRLPTGDPCLKCASCTGIDQGHWLDYLEIDGASNNSVDHIRDLVEGANYLPTASAHKIVAIDEVHMLSTSAFNALLKTLEEPPAHFIFLFATTDPQKLLGTVLSRCQRYDLTHHSTEDIAQYLKKISVTEGFSFVNEKLYLVLAQLAKGSMRDALSLLEQILSLAGGAPVTEELFYKSLGLVQADVIKNLAENLLMQESEKTSQLLVSLIQQNASVKKIHEQLVTFFYELCQSQEKMERADVKKPADLKFAEAYWIFEQLVKEGTWIFQSAFVEYAYELLLIKIAKRRTLYRPRTESKSATVEKTVTSQERVFRTSYAEFVENVAQTSPLIAASLEQGNYLQPPRLHRDNNVRVEIGIDPHHSVAFEALRDKAFAQKLETAMRNFLELKSEALELDLIQLTIDQQVKKQFKSLAQLRDEKKQAEKERRQNEILNNPYIKEAEELFRSKIDKVIIEERE